MPRPPEPRYAQAFGNAQLNSVLGRSLHVASPHLHKATTLDLFANGPPDRALWLLSDDDIFVAVGRMQHWVIHPRRAITPSVGRSDPHLFVLLESGHYVHGGGRVIVRGPNAVSWAPEPEDEGQPADEFDDEPDDEPDDEEDEEEEDKTLASLPVDGMQASATVLAFVRVKDGFVLVVQSYGHQGDSNARDITAVRREWAKDRQETPWVKTWPALGGRSPVLSNGVVMLGQTDGVFLIDKDGKELGRVADPFILGMMSVDLQDTLWGLREHEKGLRLVRLASDGALLLELDLGPGAPMQPPVTLPDGRVVVATRDRIICVQDGSVSWTFPLPMTSPALKWDTGFNGGLDPLVTATADNQILVKQRHRLWLFGQEPTPTWEIATPNNEPITSNPIVTRQGWICVACGLEVYCTSS